MNTKDCVVVKASTIISTTTNSKCVRFTQVKEIEIETKPNSELKSKSKFDMHVIATLWDQYDHHIFSVNERHYTFTFTNTSNDASEIDLKSLKFDFPNSLEAIDLKEEDAPRWIVNSIVFRDEHGKSCARLKFAVEYASFDVFGVDDLQSVEGQFLIKIRRQ